MNKQNIQKLALLLSGLENRITENADYFLKIVVDLKSGLKTFTASILYKNDKLQMHFNGREEVFEISWLSARLSKICEAYDAVTVTYEERGNTIIIEADGRNVRTRYVEPGKETKDSTPHTDSKSGTRSYYIKTGEANELLKEIGILSQDGKLKNDMIRKYNQIDHFVELIDGMLRNRPVHEAINVLDCGCGKSYLSFVLNYYIREVLRRPCTIIGLDYSEKVIEASREAAARLKYNNMRFFNTDIKTYTPDRDIHLVISLHACDTATDEALAAAVRFGAKNIAAVPCCHRELLKQYALPEMAAIIKHGVLKHRMADVLTDGLRALLLEAMGYSVSVVEYISPLETPKNLLIRAEKTGGPNKKALDEYQKIKRHLGIQPSLEYLLYEVEDE